MKSTMLFDLMVKDHARIINLLDHVEQAFGSDRLAVINVFDTFEWALEKHIFTEEKAIFTSYAPTNVREGYKMVPELIKEHNDLLNRLRTMRQDIVKGRSSDVSGFKEILASHRRFEEESLYPQLDQELDENQKMRIVSRIQEIL
jgi:hemerythrin superfamily protein